VTPVSQGPQRPPEEWADREARARKRRVALWHALWNASQDMTAEEIEEFVGRVLVEMREDA
jgi:hypothetical protein